MIYVEKYDLLLVGFQTGEIIIHNAKLEFKEINKIDCGVNCWKLSINYDEERDVLFGTVELYLLRSWKIKSDGSFCFLRDYKYPGINISSFMPISCDNKKTILMGSHLTQVSMFDVSTGKFWPFLRRNYDGFYLVKNKRMIIMTSFLSRTLDFYSFCWGHRNFTFWRSRR